MPNFECVRHVIEPFEGQCPPRSRSHCCFFSSFPPFCLCLKMASSRSARGVKDEFRSAPVRMKQCWKPGTATPSSHDWHHNGGFFYRLHLCLQEDVSDVLMSRFHCCSVPGVHSNANVGGATITWGGGQVRVCLNMMKRLDWGPAQMETTRVFCDI